MSRMAAQQQLLTSWGGFLFIFGKLINIAIACFLIFSVVSSTDNLAGFNRDQVMVFFLVYSLVDHLSQFLFRGAYTFRWLVAGGGLDLELVKPLPSFFRAVFGWADVLDFITLWPLLGLVFYFFRRFSLVIGFLPFVSFLFLLINALLIAFAFHLLVCSVGVLTLEVDHLVWLWRDLFKLGRLPVDIYPPGLRFILTWIFPVAVLVSLPAKVILGLLNPWLGLLLLPFGLFLAWVSLVFWRFSLRCYSSASS